METYAEFKNGGWIGLIPDSWQIRRISSLYDPRNEKVSDKDYPALSVTMQGILPQLETAAKTQDGDNRKLVKKGDFAINSRSDRRGSCGISAYDGSVSLITNVLAPRANVEMSNQFFEYLFRSTGFSDEYYKHGTGIVDDLWSTNWSRMKNIQIAVPPIGDQIAIVAFLDEKVGKLDETVAEIERSIELLQEYRQSVISEAVTRGLDSTVPMKDSDVEWIGEIPEHWISRKLKHVASNRLIKASSNEGDYIGLENIQSWTMSFVPSKDKPNDESDGILYDNQCVLFGKLRPYLAKAFLPASKGPCSSEFLALVPNDINRKYLAFQLTCWAFIDEINSLTYGVKMPRAGWDLIGNIQIALPPEEEQVEIVLFLEQKTSEIDSLIANKQKQVNLLKEYRGSLISEAVTGKFKVPGLE